MGVEWVTVHGRTRSEKTQAPVRVRAIELLQRAARVSVIYNGDVNTPDEMREAVAKTGTVRQLGGLILFSLGFV